MEVQMTSSSTTKRMFVPLDSWIVREINDFRQDPDSIKTGIKIPKGLKKENREKCCACPERLDNNFKCTKHMDDYHTNQHKEELRSLKETTDATLKQLNTKSDRNRAEVEAIRTKPWAEVLEIQAMASLSMIQMKRVLQINPMR